MNLGRKRKGSELGMAGVRALPCDGRKRGKDVPWRSWGASRWEYVQEASFGHLDIGRALREEPGGLGYILCRFFYYEGLRTLRDNDTLFQHDCLLLSARCERNSKLEGAGGRGPREENS